MRGAEAARAAASCLDSPGTALYNPGPLPPLPPVPAEPGAQVAQLVEHVTENHGVGGSIPPLGTTILLSY